MRAAELYCMKKNSRSPHRRGQKKSAGLLPLVGLVLILAFVTAALARSDSREDLPLPQVSDQAF
jgi:hypothetical protein